MGVFLGEFYVLEPRFRSFRTWRIDILSIYFTSQNEIEAAVESKFLQLKMADELEEQGTRRTVRRAKLWRRCAAMAEVLAKEHAEALLWKRKFEEAAFYAFGNQGFY